MKDNLACYIWKSLELLSVNIWSSIILIFHLFTPSCLRIDGHWQVYLEEPKETIKENGSVNFVYLLHYLQIIPFDPQHT